MKTHERNVESQLPTHRELTDDELTMVSGGRKSGEGQKDFLVVTLKEAFITGVT